MTTFKIPQPEDHPEPVNCEACGQVCSPDYLPIPHTHCGAQPIPFTRYCPNCNGWYGAGEHCPCTAPTSPVDEFFGAPATLPPEPIRGAILDAAKAHTLGDRNDTHGDPIPAMELFMDLVEPILERRKSLPKAAAGALILDAYKRARILHNPYHRDSYEDGCAYTAIAGEAAHRSRTTP